MLLTDVENTLPLLPYLDRLLDLGENLNLFETVHKVSLWERLTSDPELASNFNRAMENMDGMGGMAPVLDYPWGERCDVVIDVAGGKGRFLANILEQTDVKSGILFDLESVITEAKTEWAKRYSKSANSRVSYVGGSFFNVEDLPKSKQESIHCYVLRNVLHDWSDKDTHTILANLAYVMSNQDKLIITEVLPDEFLHGPESASVTSLDIIMATIQGKERTISQFNALLEKSGLDPIQEVTETRSLFKVAMTKRHQMH